ncbi:MAG TPA: hypothetical protein VGP72_12660 [Planctomycetota bacterium]
MRIRLQVPPHTLARHKWTPAEVELLGTMSDGELAERLGLRCSTIKNMRLSLKIPALRPSRQWKPEETKLLGALPDKALANQLGIHESSVRKARTRLNLRASQPRHDWTPEKLKLLGTMPDKELALLLGTSAAVVSYRRSQQGVAMRAGAPRIKTTGAAACFAGILSEKCACS